MKKASKRLNKHHLSMYIPIELFAILKETCESKDITITKYVLRSITMRLKMESNKKL